MESLRQQNEDDYEDEESLVSESDSDENESIPPPLPPKRDIDLSNSNQYVQSLFSKKHYSINFFIFNRHMDTKNIKQERNKNKAEEEAEKTKIIADKLIVMKRKQQEQEKWERIKRSWFYPLRNLGIGVIALSGSVMLVAYLMNYKK